jgi:NAD(P)H-dependent FMN reductase
MDHQDGVTIAAISSSQRPASSLGALVTAAERLSSASVMVCAYPQLRDLPPLAPALDGASIPAVARWRARVHSSDGLLICCPEYAYGLPGLLATALGWLSDSGALAGKPVALVNTSPHATHAWAPLVDTLLGMSACVIGEASIAIPLRPFSVLTADAIVADHQLSSTLRTVSARLADAIRRGRCPRPSERRERPADRWTGGARGMGAGLRTETPGESQDSTID